METEIQMRMISLKTRVNKFEREKQSLCVHRGIAQNATLLRWAATLAVGFVVILRVGELLQDWELRSGTMCNIV